jgi:hypothetical protein
MLLAAEEIGFWGAFFLMLIFIPLIMLWVFTLMDIFQRSDLSGWAKALWVILVLILPIFGMLIYFIVRPTLPEDIAAQEEYRQMRDISQAADVTDKLHKLSELRDKGDITQEEFDKQKAKLMGD